jgi:hypothetical protein
MNLYRVLSHSLLTTGFVFVMMLIVEYLNVATSGLLRDRFQRGGLAGYAGMGLLGSAPGCLGAFAAVALYVHGVVPFGAIVTNMIATSGDEAFIMLALFPGRALALFAILLVYGVAVGYLADRLLGRPNFAAEPCPTGLSLHEDDEDLGRFLLRPCSLSHFTLQRGALSIALALFILVISTGAVGPERWTWLRVTLLVLSAAALWIVLSVPEHFLEEHLYTHVAREHVPRVFLWVLGVLLLIEWARAAEFPIESTIQSHPALALLAALVVGIVPESGPHLVFVTLYAQGSLPFSVLLASSVAQDGHGSLPLLAESRVEFLKVKAVNVAAAAVLGLAALALGY